MDNSPALRTTILSWMTLVLTILAGLVAVLLFFLNRETAVPASWGTAGGARNDLIHWFNFLQLALIAPIIAGVFGVLIVRRQVGWRIGWSLLFIGWFSAFQSFTAEWAIYGYYTVPNSLPGYGVAAWITNWAWVAIYTLLLLMVSIFPNGHFLSPRWRLLLIILLTSMLLTLGTGSVIETPMSSAFQIPNPFVAEHPTELYNLHFAIGVPLMPLVSLAVLISLIRRYRQGKGRERHQIKWLMGGGASLCGLIVLGLALSLILELRLGEVLVNTSTLAPLIGIGVALLRHQLYDIDIIIRRTLIYSAVSVVLALVYFGSVIVWQQLFSAFVSRQSPAAIVISTLIIAALFNPVRRRTQAIIDRRFYRRKFDVQQTLAAFALKARDEVELEVLTAELVRVVQETMQPETISFWLKRPDIETTLDLDIAPSDPLVLYFQSTPGVIEVEKLNLDSPALVALKRAGFKLIVPLISQGELVGLINLGQRLSEQAYSGEDRKLLQDLAGQAAPAVRVAQLARQQQREARQRERIEQELRVARLIQQTLLPKKLPQPAGYELAAYYQPAREVGGDFYDFLHFEDGQIALIIGDVTDKGVPAALVMATTRTLLRASGERLVTPGEVLKRVNDLLYPDIPPRMFVTCFYALLDPASGRLRYANAGHDLPYRQHQNGVDELRATGMPLGLMPGMSYEEKEIRLSPGDTVLFYSDGLAEAHDPEGEMFGFPRVQSCLAGHPGGSALVEHLLNQLSDFTGPGWEQEDDVTLVTLQYQEAKKGGNMEKPGFERSWQRVATLTIPSQAGNERQAMEDVAAQVASTGLSAARLERLKTAVAEATMNAMEHGNQYQPDVPVLIDVLAAEDAVAVQITDRGSGPELPQAEMPDLEAKLAGMQSPRGWGLFLIQNMVDEMIVHQDNGRHMVELIMHLEERK